MNEERWQRRGTMTALPKRERISVEEYLRLDRASQDARYEYFNGEVTLLANSTEKHNLINGNVCATLWNLLRGTGYWVYGSAMRVHVSNKKYVYPDVTVACKPQVSEEDILENPRVIVEVLSPSTEIDDRVKKFSSYKACPTVEEYVLVNTTYQKVEIYRRERGIFWIYAELGPLDELHLTSLNVHFPVAAIYESVDVPDTDTDEE
jgi:Uma2 family endonuclease